MNKVAFAYGFIKKCREYQVDPVRLFKFGAAPVIPPKPINQAITQVPRQLPTNGNAIGGVNLGTNAGQQGFKLNYPQFFGNIGQQQNTGRATSWLNFDDTANQQGFNLNYPQFYDPNFKQQTVAKPGPQIQATRGQIRPQAQPKAQVQPVKVPEPPRTGEEFNGPEQYNSSENMAANMADWGDGGDVVRDEVEPPAAPEQGLPADTLDKPENHEPTEEVPGASTQGQVPAQQVPSEAPAQYMPTADQEVDSDTLGYLGAETGELNFDTSEDSSNNSGEVSPTPPPTDSDSNIATQQEAQQEAPTEAPSKEQPEAPPELTPQQKAQQQWDTENSDIMNEYFGYADKDGKRNHAFFDKGGLGERWDDMTPTQRNAAMSKHWQSLSDEERAAIKQSPAYKAKMEQVAENQRQAQQAHQQKIDNAASQLHSGNTNLDPNRNSGPNSIENNYGGTIDTSDLRRQQEINDLRDKSNTLRESTWGKSYENEDEQTKADRQLRYGLNRRIDNLEAERGPRQPKSVQYVDQNTGEIVDGITGARKTASYTRSQNIAGRLASLLVPGAWKKSASVRLMRKP